MFTFIQVMSLLRTTSLVVVVIGFRRHLLLLSFNFNVEGVVVWCLHALGPPVLQIILLQHLLVLLIIRELVQVLVASPLLYLLLLLLCQLLIATL